MAFLEFMHYFNISVCTDSADTESRKDFNKVFGGNTFGNGIFTVLSSGDIEIWKNIVSRFYPDFVGKIEPFAFDWLGRCFAEDTQDKSHILLFEIGTADVLIIPVDFKTFVNDEIPNNNAACLASEAYTEWISSGLSAVSYGQCIGYKVPLFLGGDDSFSNMELSSLDVYWDIIGQVKLQTK